MLDLIAAAGITLLPLLFYAARLNNRQASRRRKKERLANPYKEEIIHAHAAHWRTG